MIIAKSRSSNLSWKILFTLKDIGRKAVRSNSEKLAVLKDTSCFTAIFKKIKSPILELSCRVGRGPLRALMAVKRCNNSRLLSALAGVPVGNLPACVVTAPVTCRSRYVSGREGRGPGWVGDRWIGLGRGVDSVAAAATKF